MTDIDFPEYLNKVQQSSFSRTRSEGFVTSDPASGPAFYVIETEDLPTVYNVEFIFSPDESLTFSAWQRKYKDVLFGALFNMRVYGEGEDKLQEVRFTQGGTPQLVGVQSLQNVYRAQIECRKVIEDGEGSEDLILGVAENGGSDLLQIIVNNDMPRV